MDGATVTLVFGEDEDEDEDVEEDAGSIKPFSTFLDGTESFGAVAPNNVDQKDGLDILYSINRK